MEDENEVDTTATKWTEEDSEDEDPEADLIEALRSAFFRLSARRDELACRHQM